MQAAVKNSAGSQVKDGEAPLPVKFPVVGLQCPEALAEHEWTVGRFHCTKKLGAGMASKVYTATCKRTGMEVALKCYVKRMLRPRIREQVFGEITIHSRLVHPNVVGFYAAFEDADNYWLVLELASKGDLYQEMVNIPMDEAVIARYVLLPLVSAIAYLHNNIIMHRDLKPENVVMTGDTVKLADFGFAVNQRHKRALSRVGTTDFMAPEMIMIGNGHYKVFRDQMPREIRRPYDHSVDVWAIGVMAYELVTRNAPFSGKTEELLIEAIQKGTYQIPSSLSRPFRDFLQACLSTSPEARSPAMDLLHHPYLTSHASDRTLRRFRELAEAKADIEPGTPSTPNTSQRTLQVGETESLKYIQGGSWRLSVPGNRSSEAGNRSSEAGNRSSEAGTAAVAVAVAPSKAHTADDMSRAAAVPLTPTMTSVDSSSSLQSADMRTGRMRGGTVNPSESGSGAVTPVGVPGGGPSAGPKREFRRFLSEVGMRVRSDKVEAGARATAEGGLARKLLNKFGRKNEVGLGACGSRAPPRLKGAIVES